MPAAAAARNANSRNSASFGMCLSSRVLLPGRTAGEKEKEIDIEYPEEQEPTHYHLRTHSNTHKKTKHIMEMALKKGECRVITEAGDLKRGNRPIGGEFFRKEKNSSGVMSPEFWLRWS
jgi:hypothetical protein